MHSELVAVGTLTFMVIVIKFYMVIEIMKLNAQLYMLCHLKTLQLRRKKYYFLQRNCIFFFYLNCFIPFGVTRRVFGPIPAANRQRQGNPDVSPTQLGPCVRGLVLFSGVPQWCPVGVLHHPLLPEQWGQKRYHRPLTTIHDKIEFSIIK